MSGLLVQVNRKRGMLMVSNKWLAGAGTKALSLDMLAGAVNQSNSVGRCGQGGTACDKEVPENIDSVVLSDDDFLAGNDADGAGLADSTAVGQRDSLQNPIDVCCEKTLVCIDDLTIRQPDELGFAKEEHLHLPFVRKEGLSVRARLAFGDSLVTDAFVVSTNDMPALNVAASLKKDAPGKQVFLVSDDTSEQFLRKAAFALVDGVVPRKRFYQEVLSRHIKSPKEDELSGEEEEQECESSDSANTMPLTADAADVISSGAYAASVGSQGVYAADVLLASLPSGASPESFEESDFELEEPYEILMPERQERGSLIEATHAVGCVARENESLNEAPSRSGKQRLMSHAFYLPVISASGGVGVSSIAFLAALCSVRLGCKTLLMDLDAQFGDMAMYAQADEIPTLDQLADNPDLIERIEPGREGFCLVGACDLPERSEDLTNKVNAVLEHADSRFDVIISNGPCSWDDQHVALLERAGKVLFVLDQRASSARAAQKAFDLCMRCGLAASPFLFLLNKCNRQAQLTYLDVTCAMQGATCKELPDGGRAVGEYFETCQAGNLLDERNVFASAVLDVVTDILPGCNILKGVKQASRPARFFFGRKKRKEAEACH